MVTTALVFDHRGRTAPDKEGPIEVRVTIDGTVRYIATGVRVIRKQWQHGLILDRYDAEELNERLAILKRRVESLINQAMAERRAIDIASIRSNLYTLEKTIGEDSFLQWIEEQIPLLDVTEGTRKHYVTLYSRLVEFGRMRSWGDLTVDNIYKFDAWLHSLEAPLTEHQISAGVQPKTIVQGTIYNYHKNLRALMQRAYKIGIIKTLEDNPYTKLKGEFGKGTKESIEYLTEDEMHLIVNLHPTPGTRLAMARDVFVVQMYTGLAFTDTMGLDLSKYKKVDGKWINNGERVKTGVPYVSSLLPPVVEVLERYGWAVPQMKMSHYNATLKTLGKTLGITANMHSHLARHTFATYMLRNGVKIENLARMLGHTDIKQTQRYAKVLALSVHEDFEMINKKLQNK